MPDTMPPPPATAQGRTVVAPDVEAVEATLRFDVTGREAEGRARVSFRAGAVTGRPALDLRQPLDWVRLDGRDLPPDAFAHSDLGGGPGAEMRVLDVELAPGSHHVLEVGYQLGTPDATGAAPLEWVEGGLRFDLWMSDLEPGRYLEMWVPAPLCHDRFAASIEVELVGAGRRHTLVANTAGIDAARVGPGGRGQRWALRYPAHFTSLSPLLVVAPSDEVEVRRSATRLPGQDRSLGLVCARHLEVDADLAACEADVTAWLTYMAARYGPWVHGDTFWAFVWGPGRGMEYDGATTASVEALEHEVFHSWFGRGVKPARAADGWIDEAWTSWATATRRAATPRFGAEELGLDEPPVQLYPPHAWARRTPREAYTDGARLFSGLAALLGGPDRLRSAMAAWYRAHAGRLVTTDGLVAHLQAWSGLDLTPWWARYVHGRA